MAKNLDLQRKSRVSMTVKFLPARNMIRWILPCEYVLIIVGVFAAIILGLSVPGAIFLVGEVVTLFIKNRRARLATLLEEGEHHTDYDKETDVNVEVLAKELEEAQVANDLNISAVANITFHNHTLQEELNLNYELNEKFEASLHFLCLWMLSVSLCQLLSAFLTTFTFDLVAERVSNRILRSIKVSDVQETGADDGQQSCEKSHFDEVQKLRKGVDSNFSLLISACVTLTGCVGMAFYRRWQLALIIAPLLLFNFYGKTLITMAQKTTTQKLKCETSSVWSRLQETLNAVVTVVALRQERSEIKRFVSQLKNLERYTLKNSIISGIGSGMILMASHLLNSIMLWYGVRLIIDDLKSDRIFRPGTPVVVFFAFLRGLVTFNQSLEHINTLKLSVKAIKYMRQELEMFDWQDKYHLITSQKFDDNKFSEERLDANFSTNNKSIVINQINKSAVLRLALHTRCSCDQQRPSKNENQTERYFLLEFMYPQLVFISLGCLGSVILGAALPVTFYIFCEIIGAMANLEEELVYQRTSHMLSAYAVLAICTLFGSFLQTYMTNIFCFRYSNKVRRSLIEAFFDKEKEMAGSKEHREELDDLIHKKLPLVELALRGTFCAGVQIVSSVLVAIPLAGGVIWSQTAILIYIFPVLILMYYLQYRVSRKSKKENSEELNPNQKYARTFYSSVLWGVVRAFREMVFATILFYGGYAIIHFGVNNKNVLQVNLILINTALQLSPLINVAVNVKRGWKAAFEIDHYLIRDKSNVTITKDGKHETNKIVPELPLMLSFCDFPTPGVKIDAYPGQTVVIHVDDKKVFYQLLLGGHSPLHGKMLINSCNIRDISTNWIRSNVAIISEEIQFLFPSRSLHENISYGNNSIRCAFEVANQLANYQDLDAELNSIPIKWTNSHKKNLILSRCLSKKSPIIIMDEDFLSEDFKLENEQILVIVRNALVE